MDIKWKERVLRSMRKTPVIVNAFLRDVTQEWAQTARDGQDGWTVLEIMCHIRDFETIYFERARSIVESDLPHSSRVDHLALVGSNAYAQQNLSEVLSNYIELRQEFVNWLVSLPDEAWARKGVYNDLGEINLAESVTNTVLHDLNHIEQLVRSLELSNAVIR
jgi:hypothetical protein